MSFEELNAIAKDHHENRTHELHTLKMNSALRGILREKFGDPTPGAPSANFTEAFEMSAMKSGLPFMANLNALTGIRIWIDESLPDNAWKLVDGEGKVLKEGTVE